MDPAPDISVCIVSTEWPRGPARAAWSRCSRHPPSVPFEVLVLDNASTDGTAAAVQRALRRPRRADRARPAGAERRRTTRTLMSRARGRWCLLLNEDSELTRGSGGRAARRARARPAGGGRGRAHRDPRTEHPSRRPGASRASRAALAGALFAAPPAHRPEPRRADAGGGLGAVGRDARAARRLRAGRAARPGLLRVLGRGRLAAARARRRLVGPVRARPRRSCTASSSRTATGAQRRIVEFSRNRDRYMRKHHGPARRAGGAGADGVVVRGCARWPRWCCPATAPGATAWHAYHSLFPGRGEGLREAADELQPQARVRS